MVWWARIESSIDTTLGSTPPDSSHVRTAGGAVKLGESSSPASPAGATPVPPAALLAPSTAPDTAPPDPAPAGIVEAPPPVGTVDAPAPPVGAVVAAPPVGAVVTARPAARGVVLAAAPPVPAGALDAAAAPPDGGV